MCVQLYHIAKQCVLFKSNVFRNISIHRPLSTVYCVRNWYNILTSEKCSIPFFFSLCFTDMHGSLSVFVNWNMLHFQLNWIMLPPRGIINFHENCVLFLVTIIDRNYQLSTRELFQFTISISYSRITNYLLPILLFMNITLYFIRLTCMIYTYVKTWAVL